MTIQNSAQTLSASASATAQAMTSGTEVSFKPKPKAPTARICKRRERANSDELRRTAVFKSMYGCKYNPNEPEDLPPRADIFWPNIPSDLYQSYIPEDVLEDEDDVP